MKHLRERLPDGEKPIEVKALEHAEAKRKNIPTAEFESVMDEEEKSALRLPDPR
jgi:adenine-specific DNA-methyltransferase